METAMAILTVIGCIVAIIYLKPSLRILGSHAKDIVVTNVNEDKKELIQRSEDAYKEIIETCGEDFKTPEEIYNLVCRKKQRKEEKKN